MNSDYVPLIIQAQNGDRAAFSQLVQRFQDMAVGYAYSILGDFHLAEDAAQEAFVQAYLDLSKLQEPQAFAAWFRRIVFKYCDRQYRGKRVWTVPLEQAQSISSPDPGPLHHAASRELSAKITAMIQALPEAQRMVTTLFYINGYTQTEVGEFLDVPVTTVKSRLHQARKNLQHTMTNLVEETLKQHAPGQAFTRKVEAILDGVENIEWQKGSNCFSGAVVACLKFLHEDVTYDVVAAVSGAAFHMQWAWAPDNCAPEVTLGTELARRAFWALGYAYTDIEDFEKLTPESSKAAWQQRIIANIDKGYPVIARGVVGPPECCVIAGYAQEGDILLGRSYFYKDSHGYFRQADWYKDCFGLIEIGRKLAAPPRAEIIRNTLAWAVKLARTPEMNGRATGLAAYDVWAAALEQDDDFPEHDLEVLTLRCMATVNDGFCYLSDVRRAASVFLERIAPECGAATADVNAAAAAYRAESKLHCAGMRLGPNSFASDEEKRRMVDRGLRCELARLVREAGEKDREAVEHLECAISGFSSRMPA